MAEKKEVVVNVLANGSLKLNALCVSAIDDTMQAWRYATIIQNITAMPEDECGYTADEIKAMKKRMKNFQHQADESMLKACRVTMKKDDMTYYADGIYEYCKAMLYCQYDDMESAMTWILKSLNLRTGIKKDTNEYATIVSKMIYGILTGVRSRKGLTYNSKNECFESRYTHIRKEYHEDDMPKLQRLVSRELIFMLHDALLEKFGNDFIDHESGTVNWKDFQKK